MLYIRVLEKAGRQIKILKENKRQKDLLSDATLKIYKRKKIE